MDFFQRTAIKFKCGTLVAKCTNYKNGKWNRESFAFEQRHKVYYRDNEQWDDLCARSTNSIAENRANSIEHMELGSVSVSDFRSSFST